MPGAAPYFHRGDTVGCLCLHGFTASPHEVLWLAQYLGEQGHTVYAPRLAGHGTDPHDLARVRWSDWLNSTLDGYYVLKQQCDQVYVCGLSMGGILALLISMTVAIDGAVVMAAPLQMGAALQSRTLRRIKYIRRFTDQNDHSRFAQYINEQQRQRGEPALGRVRYNLWSTAGLEQLALMIEHVVERLDEVDVPILALYSEGDQTVSTGNLELLQSKVRNQLLESYVFKNSGHILTQDIESAEVFRRTADFITRCAHAR
jgi:carboxylesterase